MVKQPLATVIFIATTLLLTSCMTGEAPELSWAETCARTLEARGGRGANVAAKLCDCVDQSADEYGASRAGIMATAADGSHFQELDQSTRRVITDCLERTGG